MGTGLVDDSGTWTSSSTPGLIGRVMDRVGLGKDQMKKIADQMADTGLHVNGQPGNAGNAGSSVATTGGSASTTAKGGSSTAGSAPKRVVTNYPRRVVSLRVTCEHLLMWVDYVRSVLGPTQNMRSRAAFLPGDL